MICDSIENSVVYNLSERFTKAFRFLANLAADTADGTYELEGQDVFAMVQTRPLSPGRPEKLEVHRKYADIQFVMEGAERLAFRSPDGMDTETPYNSVSDAEFLKLPREAALSNLEMTPGRFAVFFPCDAHYGCLEPETACGDTTIRQVRKVVVKVAV